MSVPNPYLLIDLPVEAEAEPEEIFPHPLDGEPVQVSSAWQRDSRQVTVFWHYDHLLPNGTVQRFTVQVQHYLTPTETYLAEMRQAGFSTLTLYGKFDRSAHTPRSPYLIILAS